MTGLPLLPLLSLPSLFVSCIFLCSFPPSISLYIEHANVFTGRDSPSRLKNDFFGNLETSGTPSGLRTVEHFSAVPLPSGKLLLLLNSCTGANSHEPSRSFIDQQVLFGCDVNLQQIEQWNSWRQSQLQLLGATDFPEVRGIGVWGQEGGGKVDKVLLLFWSATCRTKGETCRCNNIEGCQIKYDYGSSSSCLASVYEGKKAPQGARLCQGTYPISSSNSECYYYRLGKDDGWGCGSAAAEHAGRVKSTVSASRSEAGSVASWLSIRRDSWDRHGARLGSGPGVRYGTLFLAEFDGEGVEQWVKPIAKDAAIFDGYEQRATLVGGDVLATTGALEKQYAVTVTRERWEQRAGKSLVSHYCETILLNSNGEIEGTDIPGKDCKNCLYTSASVHPVTHTWGSLCVSNRPPKLGIFINGQLAVDSSERYKKETRDRNTLDESLSYYKDTGGRLLPVAGGSWVLIWRQVSWQVVEAEGLRATSATLKAATWEEQGSMGCLGPPVSLMGPLLEGRLRDLDAVSLSLNTAVVTAADYFRGEAMAAAVDLSKLSIIGSAGRAAVAGVQRGALFGRFYGHPLLRLSDSSAVWLGAVKENLSHSVGPSLLPPDRGPLDLFRAVKITVEEGDKDCEGKWEASSSTCPFSCLQQQVFQSNSSSSTCPWRANALHLVHCEGGDCPDWRRGASLSVTGLAANASLILDRDLNTLVELNPIRNFLTLHLAEPVDLEEVEVYVHPASVLLRMGIIDVEGNWLADMSATFVAPDIHDGVAVAEGWVTRDLSLRRVSQLELRAAPTTSLTAPAVRDQWSVGILEVRLRATPSLACAGGGFSVEEKEWEKIEKPPDTLEVLDCKGEWGEWSVCDTSCTRKRQFRIISPPKKGGRPCVASAVEPCTGVLSAGGFCTLSTPKGRGLPKVLRQLQAQQGIPLAWDPRGSQPASVSTDCVSLLSPKSQCVACRTLQIHQVTRQGRGEGKSCPADPFVLDYCDANCAALYRSTNTAFVSASSFPYTMSELNLKDERDVMLMLKTIAIYFSVVLIAGLLTAYIVGSFQAGPPCPLGRRERQSIAFYSPLALPPLASATKSTTAAAGNTAAVAAG